MNASLIVLIIFLVILLVVGAVMWRLWWYEEVYIPRRTAQRMAWWEEYKHDPHGVGDYKGP